MLYECYSKTSINCVFMLHCYFVSTVYSSLDVFYIINFMFFFILHSMLHVHLSRALKYLLTYLLTYDSVKGVQPMYIACILCYTFKLCFFVFLSVAKRPIFTHVCFCLLRYRISFRSCGLSGFCRKLNTTDWLQMQRN